MEKYTVLASESVPRNAQGNAERFLANDVIAFYHEDYHGSTGNWKKEGTIENLICTFKNDITRYTETVLQSAMNKQHYQIPLFSYVGHCLIMKQY